MPVVVVAADPAEPVVADVVPVAPEPPAPEAPVLVVAPVAVVAPVVVDMSVPVVPDPDGEPGESDDEHALAMSEPAAAPHRIPKTRWREASECRMGKTSRRNRDAATIPESNGGRHPPGPSIRSDEMCCPALFGRCPRLDLRDWSPICR